MNFKNCNNHSLYSRIKTRVVNIGDVPLGGIYPIRIQSMTNTSTLDTRSSVEQCKRIAHAGSDYIRLAARNEKEAENLSVIKKGLLKENIKIPLIADIHFNPGLAEIAARVVEKIRINPGNYGPQSADNNLELSEHHYSLGLEKIASRFISLLNICKDHGTALRIGVNHGSLSNRIMNRYGDTPAGMVESALEFVMICADENFHQVVLSMKSSNPRVMVEAYRLLINKFDETGFNYPIHLGVTEAGLGSEGRIKSAVGIGTLLNEGIGDTIRVSLTEDPEFEIPTSQKIISYYSGREEGKESIPVDTVVEITGHYNRRFSVEVSNIGGSNLPIVIIEFPHPKKGLHNFLIESGHQYIPDNNEWRKGEQGPDYIYLGDLVPGSPLPDVAGFMLRYPQWKEVNETPENLFPVFTTEEYISTETDQDSLHFIDVEAPLKQQAIIEKIIGKKNNSQTGVWPVLILSFANNSGYYEVRWFIRKLRDQGCESPVILSKTYQEADLETFQLKSSCDFGGFYIDALGDGIWLKNMQDISADMIGTTSFGILQACRSRITRPEYISCPSCGRTTFDLQKVTTEIQQVTSHLKGIKIGIMGCIVNGPGEMVDADYGYVGVGKGKVTLFKNNKIIKKGVSADNAVEELVSLIKESGDWKDP